MSNYIPIKKIREMTDEELVELSMERNSRRKLSQNAESAMKVRRERAGAQQWLGVGRRSGSYDAQCIRYYGTNE